jgi:hypothetical protein
MKIGNISNLLYMEGHNLLKQYGIIFNIQTKSNLNYDTYILKVYNYNDREYLKGNLALELTKNSFLIYPMINIIKRSNQRLGRRIILYVILTTVMFQLAC